MGAIWENRDEPSISAKASIIRVPGRWLVTEILFIDACA